MITVLCPMEIDNRLKARLASLGFGHRSFEPGSVVELNQDSVERVVLIPESMIRTAGWRKLRVELARANRLFVAFTTVVSKKGVVECMRDGAHDVLAEADRDGEWVEIIQRTVDHQRLWVQLYGGQPLRDEDVLIGCSRAIQNLHQNIERIGPTDASVILLGESGVGKEKVASALHQTGRGGPFVALNCAAIPKDLLESEMFGVERGAYTGASKSRPGLVEQAHGGTLFLDEVGELDASVQPKLLRFLETRTTRRVGGHREYSVTARIISATNRNLEREIADGGFRTDLYYRLGEVLLQIPPLRSRPEDIPQLARWFLRLSNERFGKNFQQMEPELVYRWQQYAWPGNVRELKSVIDRLVILFDGRVLRSAWWDPPASDRIQPSEGAPAGGIALALPREQPDGAPRPGPRRDAALKQEQAKRLLAANAGRYSWVAAQLGVHPSTLFRWRRAGKL